MSKIILTVTPAKAGIYCFLLFSLSFFSIPLSFAATPPQNEELFPIQSIKLTYDLIKGSLHVEAAHPSDNWERDYVRMMTVSLNGQEVTTLNYSHQTEPDGFSDDVELNAKVGDVISVALFCTGGTSMTQDLTVTKPGAAPGGQSPDSGAT